MEQQLELLWQYQQVDMEVERYEREMRQSPNRQKLIKQRDFLMEQQNVVKRIEQEVAILSDRMEAIRDEITRLQSAVADLQSQVEQNPPQDVEEARKPENSSLLPPMLALMFSGAAMAEDNGLGVRQLLVSETRAFVLNGIASGAFAGKKRQDFSSQGMVAPLFDAVSLGRKEIRQVGTPVRRGADWIVPFVLRDHGNGNDYAVRVRVSDTGGSPRVVAVDNLRQLFVILGREAGALES